MATATVEAPLTEQREKTCEKHGVYTAHLTPEADKLRGIGLPVEHLLWSGCPECEAGWQQEREKREAEKEQQKRQARVNRCLNAAAIPPRFQGRTLDTFEAQSDEQSKALAAVRAYVTGFAENLAAGRCLVLLGTVGVGKSHLACGILDSLARQGYSVNYRTAAGVIRSLRESWRKDSEKSESDVLAELMNYDLLVLDEVGLSFGGSAELVQFSDLLDLRYRTLRPTVVISNLDREGLTKFLGPRALDRLREGGGTVLVLNGQSWRGKRVQ